MLRQSALLASCIVASSMASLISSQSRTAGGPVLYESARLIVGDGSAPIENGAFVVQDGRLTAVGRKGAVSVPRGATRVDLTGKTVLPALVNAHLHIGYEGFTSWRPDNYTPQNLIDHLEREAFYGVGTVLSVGGDPPDGAIQFEKDQATGKFAVASRLIFAPGVVPPGGGPDPILIKGTTALHAVYEVTTDAQARGAVRDIANKQFRDLKIWVDDRRGTYPKMAPEVYNAVIDEAHKHQVRVHAHAIALPDQKAVVRSGADVLIHTVADQKIDDELMALLKDKKPYWTPVSGFGDRSPVCDNDPFNEQTLPPSAIEEIRKACARPSPNAAAREELLKYNYPKMIASGARLVLGTDAGILPRYSFGWAEHHELERYVEFGVSPLDAIVAATSRPAQLLGLKDVGTLAAGKHADFVVLDANPLENIRNLRQIANVYLHGTLVDRERLLSRWKRTNTTQ